MSSAKTSFRWPPSPAAAPAVVATATPPYYVDPARPAFLQHSETINAENR